jgi:threonine/homoserine/homoserine lactone efflux protein
MHSFIDSYFLKGFLVGISVAAPIGPVAIFCIRQTLAFGTLAGLAAGLGVSLADGVYAWLAAYSTQLIESFVQTYFVWFYLTGGAFLLFLGVTVFRSSPPSKEGADISHRSLFRSFYRTLLLTFASPMTTLLFIGMFTAYGVFEEPLKASGLMSLVIGVFSGALTWWIILAFSTHFIQSRFDMNAFKYINRISGFLITGYGLFALYKFVDTFFFP